MDPVASSRSQEEDLHSARQSSNSDKTERRPGPGPWAENLGSALVSSSTDIDSLPDEEIQSEGAELIGFVPGCSGFKL
jgi:hypothetical protein